MSLVSSSNWSSWVVQDVCLVKSYYLPWFYSVSLFYPTDLKHIHIHDSPIYGTVRLETKLVLCRFQVEFGFQSKDLPTSNQVSQSMVVLYHQFSLKNCCNIIYSLFVCEGEVYRSSNTHEHGLHALFSHREMFPRLNVDS